MGDRSLLERSCIWLLELTSDLQGIAARAGDWPEALLEARSPVELFDPRDRPRWREFVDAMPTGSASVSVRLALPGDAVWVSVRQSPGDPAVLVVQRLGGGLEESAARGSFSQALLSCSRELQSAETALELSRILQAYVSRHVGYHNLWLFEAVDGGFEEVRLIHPQGQKREDIEEHAALLDVREDRMVQEIFRMQRPVVVVDARTDPRTNKAMVEQFQNRTLVQIPMVVGEQPLGGFGCGTFGAEGCKAPSPQELDFMYALGALAGAALARIRLERERAAGRARREEFEAHLLHMQKLESLGLLAGGLAHDFNNLLVGVLANANLAREGLAPDSSVQPLLELIERAGLRAADLTRQMLAYSGKGRFLVRVYDVAQLSAEMVDLVRASVPKLVDFRVDVPADAALVGADASQLRQVVMNLLTNAAEAIGNASGQVDVRVGTLRVSSADYLPSPGSLGGFSWATEAPPPGDYVELSIRDTGCGIPDTVRERVFDPFFSTKRAGRGLGMSALLGIVRSHGGALCLATKVDRGSCFRVLLPRSTASAARSERPTRSAEIPRSGCILIADDEVLVRKVLVRTLEQQGFTTVSARDGEEALSLLQDRANVFAGAVLDLNMPKLDGAEVLRRARRARPDLPILLTSGYSADTAAQEFLRSPNVAFLAKPFEVNHLRSSIASLLSS